MQQQMLVSVLNNHKVARVLWIFSFLIAREQERELSSQLSFLSEPSWISTQNRRPGKDAE